MHSLHAYFLRPGDPAVPIIYNVDRIRDGRSFTTRRVVAVQHRKFHAPLRADDGLRNVQEAPVTSKARTLKPAFDAATQATVACETPVGRNPRISGE